MIRSALIAIFTLSFYLPLGAGAEIYVEYIVDFSGSMAKIDAGERQVDSARTALIKGLAQAPQNSQIALRLYGHRVAKEQMELSCKDTELVLPFGKTDLVRAREVSALYEPKGYTPIAHSLLEASKDFPAASEGTIRTMILLSDGEETCGGDPVEVIRKLKSQGFNVTVHTIGFNVDEKTRSLLEAIAVAGDGRYFDAKGNTQLYQAIEEASKESFALDKNSSEFEHGGIPIRGGDDFASAVELPFGQKLKLDHHQRKGQYDYFFFDLAQYETISLWGKTLELGVNILPDGRTIESKDSAAPRGAFEVRRASDNKPLLWSSHIGKFNEDVHLFHAHEAGRFYLLVGGSYHIHKDGFHFLAQRLGFSGDERIKGGITRETATPLELGKTLKIDRHLGKDEYLYFALKMNQGDRFKLNIAPFDKGMNSSKTPYQLKEGNPYVAFELSAPTKKKVKKWAIADAFTSVSDELVAPESGIYTLIIGASNRGHHADGFSFKVEVGQLGDLGTTIDAGDNNSDAMLIVPGQYPENNLSSVDEKDLFVFKPKEVGTFKVIAVPTDELSRAIEIDVIDNLKRKIASGRGEVNAGVVSDPFEVNPGAEYFIQIKLHHKLQDQVQKYELRLQAAD